MPCCRRCTCAASRRGEFQEALSALLGQDAPNLSPSVIGRLTGEWQAEYEQWQARDFSARQYVYLWADGIYLQARMEAQAECMLVLIGATPDGRKELIGFQVGVRESTQSWRELLVDMKGRGLSVAPKIAVGDGALGFWKALDEVFPGTRHQRCWLHKVMNIFDKVPKSVQGKMKVDLREISAAPTSSTLAVRPGTHSWQIRKLSAPSRSANGQRIRNYDGWYKLLLSLGISMQRGVQSYSLKRHTSRQTTSVKQN